MGKTHQKSVIRQAIERFDTLMAIGESRFEAKQAARLEAEARGEHIGLLGPPEKFTTPSPQSGLEVG